MKKTLQEELRDKVSLPKVFRLEKRFPCYNAVHNMGAQVGDFRQMSTSADGEEIQECLLGRLEGIARDHAAISEKVLLSRSRYLEEVYGPRTVELASKWTEVGESGESV